MHSKNTKSVLVIISLVLLITSAAISRPRKMQRLSSGSWGGPHIRMRVEGSTASIDYDCANGTVNGPLTIDSRGRFSWRGTHQVESMGPVRIGREPKNQAAIYTGSINGKTMTLTVKLASNDEEIGTFTLEQGKAGRVFKCK